MPISLKRTAKTLSIGVASLLALSAHADTLIKEETLSFAKCLDVIAITSEQISIEPRVTVDRKNLKIVEYDLEDGILMISCDGKKQLVRISSKG